MDTEDNSSLMLLGKFSVVKRSIGTFNMVVRRGKDHHNNPVIFVKATFQTVDKHGYVKRQHCDTALSKMYFEITPINKLSLETYQRAIMWHEPDDITLESNDFIRYKFIPRAINVFILSDIIKRLHDHGYIICQDQGDDSTCTHFGGGYVKFIIFGEEAVINPGALSTSQYTDDGWLTISQGKPKKDIGPYSWVNRFPLFSHGSTDKSYGTGFVDYAKADVAATPDIEAPDGLVDYGKDIPYYNRRSGPHDRRVSADSMGLSSLRNELKQAKVSCDTSVKTFARNQRKTLRIRAGLEADIKRLSDLLNFKERQIRGQYRELEVLRRQIDDYGNVIEELQKELKKVKVSRDTRGVSNVKLLKAATVLRNDKRFLEGELKKYMENESGLRRQIDDYGNVVEELQKELNEARKQPALRHRKLEKENNRLVAKLLKAATVLSSDKRSLKIELEQMKKHFSLRGDTIADQVNAIRFLRHFAPFPTCAKTVTELSDMWKTKENLRDI